MLLAGDIGGTKVDLGVFTAESGPRSPLARAEFPSAEFASLSEIARTFLDRGKFTVDRACFAVAGPVIDGAAKVTNLPWHLDEPALARDLDLRSVHLMNDLEAITTGAIGLHADELVTLNAGSAETRGSIAVIAPGTGLGEGFAMWTGTGYQAYPSEGGHADFAPTDAVQDGLLAFLRERHGRVSYERVCSGIGVPGVYQYLAAAGPVPESRRLADALAATEDPTRTILSNGVGTDPDPLCRRTVELFVSVLAAKAGNLALTVLSTGGVFLAGGIPIHIRSALENGSFMRHFTDKGRLARVLERMPVRIVMTRAALIGAATTGLALGD